MAKKLDAEYDSPLSELDFEFTDDYDVEFNQEAVEKKTRSPVMNAVVGVGEGVKDTLKSPEFLKSTLRKSLPDSYGTIADGVGEIATGTYQLYDQTVRELKPQVNRIANRIDSLVPEEGIARKITDKVFKILGVDKEVDWGAQPNQEEAGIQAALASVFQQQMQSDQLERGREIVRDKIEQKRHEGSQQIFQRLATDTSVVRQYTTTINQAYQQKSLEIQLRSYLSAQDYQRKSLNFLEAFRIQNESIIKNTALPEYAKITASERFMDNAKNRFINNLYGEGSILKQGMERLKETGREFVSGIQLSLDNIEMTIDASASAKEQLDQMNEMLIEMGEQPMTAAQMAGASLGQAGIEKIRDEFAKRIKGRLDKNPQLVEKFSRVARIFRNPAGEIDTLRRSEDWDNRINDYQSVGGSIARGIDFILEHMTDSKQAQTFDRPGMMNQLSQPTFGFDNKAHLSLTDIIPGHLAAIRREITVLRTGDENTPLYKYDYDRGQFVTQKQMASRIKESLSEATKRSGMAWRAKSAAGDFVGRDEEGKSVEQELSIFLSQISRVGNMEYTPDNLMNTTAFERLSPQTQAYLEKRLTDMDTAEDRERQLNRLTGNIRSIRESIPSLNKQLDEYIRAGFADELIDLGILRREPNGDYEVNHEAFSNFLDDQVRGTSTTGFGAILSDRNKKQGIEEVTAEEASSRIREKLKMPKQAKIKPMAKGQLKRIRSDVNTKEELEPVDSKGALSSIFDRFKDNETLKRLNPQRAVDGFKKTKLFNWIYKPGVGDEEEHTGPMAQDVQRNFGNEVAPEGKSIDLQSMNGAVMAGMQQLATDVDELKTRKQPFKLKQTKDPLQAIQHDVRTIREQIQKIVDQPVGMGGGGAGFAGWSKDAGYAEILGHLTHALSQLGIQMGTDALTGAKETFSYGRDKVAKPIWSFITEKYSKHKDKIADSFTTLYEKAMGLGESVIDFGKKTINDTIPAGLRSAKDFLTNVKKTAANWINEQRDLYLPDGTEPVIRALMLKTGQYYDEATGLAVTTIDELKNAKGAIVDKAGNVIVSIEERAKGLRDRYGAEIQSTLTMLAGGALEIGKNIKDRALRGAKFLMEEGKKGWKSFSANAMDKLRGFDFSNMPGVGFGMDRESQDAILDIRDILLGEEDKVRKRLSLLGEKQKKSLKESIEDAVSNVAQTVAPVAEAVSPEGEAVAAPLGSASTQQPMRLGGLLNKAKTFAQGKLGGKAKEAASGGLGRVLTATGLGGMAASAMMNQGIGGMMGPQRPDIGQAADYMGPPRPQASELMGPARPNKAQLLASRFKNTKVGGLLGKAGGLAAGAGGLLGGVANFFGGSDEAKEADAHTDAQKAQAMAEGPEQGLAQRIKRILPKSMREKGDTDGDGVRDGSVEDRKRRQEELKASRQKKGAEADLTARYKGGGIGDLLGMFKNVLGFLGTGMTKLFGMATAGLGKLAGAAVAGAKGLGALGKKGLVGGAKLAGKAAWSAGKFALTRALPTIAAGGAKLFGGAAASVAGAIATPFILKAAAIAGIGYGIWKAYEWVTRNRVTPIQELRLRQYGFAYNEQSTKFNYLPLALEAYLQDGRVGYRRTGEAYLNEQKIKPDEIMELFKIEPEDEEGAARFNKWFTERFRPVFLTHVTTLYKVDPKKTLKDVEDLSDAQKLEYLEMVRMENGPYDAVISPYRELPVLSAETMTIKEGYDEIINKLRDKAKSASKTPPRPSTMGQAQKPLIEAPKDAAQDIVAAAKKKEEARTSVTKPSMTGVSYSDMMKGKQPQVDGMTGAALSVQKPIPSQESATASPEAAAIDPTINVQSEDGAKTDQAATGPSLDLPKAAAPSTIPAAIGSLKDGSGANQYLRLYKGATLEGLNPAVKSQFLGMVQEYGERTGKSVQVNDGKRSYEDQAALHRKDPKRAAPPGRSLHEFGFAIDTNRGEANEMDQMGLMRKYGFTRPVGGEPWHLEPAGIQRSIETARRNPAEGTQMVLASIGRGGGGYGTLSNSVKYRRNHEMAMQLLNVPSAFVSANDTPKDATASGPAMPPEEPTATANATPTSGQALREAVNTALPAANDSSLAASEQKSATNDLPLPPEQESDALRPSLDQAADPLEAEKPPAGEDQQLATGDDSIKDQIAKHARRANMKPEIIQAFAAVESDMNPQAKAPNSSARGLLQFMPKTWNEQMGKHGNKYGLKRDTSPLDLEASVLLGSEYLKTNSRSISSVKPNPNVTDLYLTHFMGAGGARAFLSAMQQNPNGIAAHRFVREAGQNRNIFYHKSGQPRTFTEIYELMGDKITKKAGLYGIRIDKPSDPGLKMGTGAPELKGELPSTTSMPASKPAPLPSGPQIMQAQSTPPEPKPSTPSRIPTEAGGAYVSPEGNTDVARAYRAKAEPITGLDLNGLQSGVEKSNEHLANMTDLLRDILNNVKTEKVAEVLAAVMVKTQQSGAESMAQKDQRNMGRTGVTGSASLDLSRKAS